MGANLQAAPAIGRGNGAIGSTYDPMDDITERPTVTHRATLDPAHVTTAPMTMQSRGYRACAG
jgi:hypothetical protein